MIISKIAAIGAGAVLMLGAGFGIAQVDALNVGHDDTGKTEQVQTAPQPVLIVFTEDALRWFAATSQAQEATQTAEQTTDVANKATSDAANTTDVGQDVRQGTSVVPTQTTDVNPSQVANPDMSQGQQQGQDTTQVQTPTQDQNQTTDVDNTSDSTSNNDTDVIQDNNQDTDVDVDVDVIIPCVGKCKHDNGFHRGFDK